LLLQGSLGYIFAISFASTRLLLTFAESVCDCLLLLFFGQFFRWLVCLLCGFGSLCLLLLLLLLISFAFLLIDVSLSFWGSSL
jgi:hypothetical protein